MAALSLSVKGRGPKWAGGYRYASGGCGKKFLQFWISSIDHCEFKAARFMAWLGRRKF
jgi:hypothetical protein